MRSRVEALSDRFHQMCVEKKVINLRLTFLAFATDMLCVYGKL